MKKKNFLSVFVLAALFCGCAQEDENNAPPSGEVQELSVTASIDGASTRIAIAPDADGVLKTTWDTGDMICVFNPVSKTAADFTLKTLSADKKTATFSGKINTAGGYLYAVYGTNTANVMPVYDDDGNETGEYGFRTNDLGYFYGQASNGNAAHLNNFIFLHGGFNTDSPVINFRHTMAFFKFTLKLPDGETFKPSYTAEITLDVPTNRYPIMNLETGTYYPNTGFGGILRVNIGTFNATDTEAVAYMAVFPSDVSGKDLKLTMTITNNGSTRVAEFEKIIPAKTPRLVEGGHYYTIDTQFDYPTTEPDGDINPMTPEAF